MKFHRRLEVQGPPKNSNAAPRKSKGEKCGEPLKCYRRSAARRAEEFWPVTAENKKGHFRLTFSFFRSFYLHLRFKRIHKYNSFCLQAEPNATFDWSTVTFVFFLSSFLNCYRLGWLLPLRKMKDIVVANSINSFRPV